MTSWYFWAGESGIVEFHVIVFEAGCLSNCVFFVAGEVLVVVIGLLLLATLPLALGWKWGPSQPSFTVSGHGPLYFS